MNDIDSLNEWANKSAVAINEFGANLKDVLIPVVKRFNGMMAPMALSVKDKRGRNKYRGKHRKHIKLLASQFRRGLL